MTDSTTKKEPRKIAFSFRVSPPELENLRERANGEPVSKLMRSVLFPRHRQQS